jgi:hypothetical protein
VRAWLADASAPDVVRRAARTALLVGTILAAINHGDALLAGKLDGARWLRIALTYFVPYAVSTTSSVATRRAMLAAATPKSPGGER